MESKLSEKRLRHDFIDRISNLPDSVLGEILSHLPVKNVVATSLLSTRWNKLFPLAVPLTELDLNYFQLLRRPRRYSSSRNFIDFVDKLFNVTLRDVHSVEKILFNCENELLFSVNDCNDKVLSWVCASLRLNVKHLRLVSYLNDSEALFDSLNGCTTLVELELGVHFHLFLPEEFTLPSLKRLSLYSLVLYDDMYSVHELIGGSPVLSDLRLVGCNFVRLDTLYIQHPCIDKLFIEGCIKQADCRVVIDAPNLEAFSYNGPSIAKYVVRNFKSFHSVCIDFDYCGTVTEGEAFSYNGRRLAKLVNECSGTKRLSFAGNSVMALYRSSIWLPTFQNLTCLEIGRMGSCGWRMLARFLKSAPNLAILTFQEELEFNRVYAGFKSSLGSLPVCLELCLKKIEIWVFQGWQDEIKLMEYFLKNGRVLQELIIHCLPYENRSQLEELSMFPRLSKTCQVLFREEGNLGKSRYARDNWF